VTCELGALVVAHLDHTTEQGGAEIALHRVLERATWQARLLLPRDDGLGTFSSLPDFDHVRIERRGPAQRPGATHLGLRRAVPYGARLALQALAVRRAPGFREADLVHANTTRAGVYGALACAGARKPLVLHLRDIVDPSSLGRLGWESARRALGRADAVIANSRATLESAEAHLSPTCVREIIPSPIGEIACSARPLRRTVRNIVMVARLDRWKGQDVLIRAFARAFAGTDTRLLLAGGTPFGRDDLLVELQRLAEREGIGGQVDFLGHVDDVPALLADSDVCVQASIRPEPLGQNVLQYLAAGRPVVAMDCGGPREWITHELNGLLVPPGEVEPLARALRRLSEEYGLRERLGVAAARTPNLPRTADVVRRHAELYSELLATRSVRR
jgi:glycosyltransferase involved in cell wall biosynthesis